jgi:hypothetical protein
MMAVKAARETAAADLDLIRVVDGQLTHGWSVWATRHYGDRIKGINGFAVLIEGRPFDPHDSLRFSLRWCELDHLAFDVNHIARAYGGKPPQVIYTEPEKRV